MKSRVVQALFLMLLCALGAAGLAAVEALLGEQIRANMEAKLQKSVLTVFGVLWEEGEHAQAFAETVNTGTGASGIEIFELKDRSAVAYLAKGQLYFGKAEIVVAFEADRVTCRGFQVISQEETPGLGARMAEADFTAQFPGKRFEPAIRVRGDASGENEIDAITGATGTSVALERLLNDSYREFREGAK